MLRPIREGKQKSLNPKTPVGLFPCPPEPPKLVLVPKLVLAEPPKPLPMEHQEGYAMKQLEDVSKTMSDEELIDYCDLHCKTHRALFPSEIVRRMSERSGVYVGLADWQAIVEMKGEMQHLVNVARRRLSKINQKETVEQKEEEMEEEKLPQTNELVHKTCGLLNFFGGNFSNEEIANKPFAEVADSLFRNGGNLKLSIDLDF